MTSKLRFDYVDLRLFKLYALAAGHSAIMAAGFVLLGPMFDASVLKSLWSGKARMKSALKWRRSY
ncbi:MAG: hypothetical protein QOF62_119 [Pyrinomonadaceae bacterium]|jgi:hypothetical protein|nr:hypothetical protein [Pyrinomonadaceae bacterium]